MKIRNLQWRGMQMWPPEWAISDQEAGDEGILEDVRLNKVLSEKLISIIANHLGNSRKGVILLEDPGHLELVYQKLKENIGKALTEIGNLEVDFNPSLPKYGLKKVRQKSSPINHKRLANKK